jgi:hypothetical protein
MRNKIYCEHQVNTDSINLFVCKIGMYGGHPYIGNCISCIKENQNNQEYAKKLSKTLERSHPSTASKLSGCCDSAKNYT